MTDSRVNPRDIRLGNGASMSIAGDSGLRQSVLRSRIAKLPHLPAIAPQAQAGPRDVDNSEGEGEGEGEEEDGDSLGPMRMAPPTSSASASAKGPSSSSSSSLGLATSHLHSSKGRFIKEMYSPLSARDCFEDALEIDIDAKTSVSPIHDPSMISVGDSVDGSNKEEVPEATFRVYYTPARHKKRKSQRGGAASLALTNRGDTDLSSIQISDLEGGNEDIGGEDDGSDSGKAGQVNPGGTVFLLHHGAGYSALSFALVAKHITRATDGSAGVLAYDCRGHGKTRHQDQKAAHDLSLPTLTRDALFILEKLFPKTGPQPTLVLVGHSMGGSVIVSLAHALTDRREGVGPRVAGVAVLDVVEGTAMAALPSMKTIVSSLPKGFDSIEQAIRWHVDSGTIVNLESAKRSVPSLLMQTSQGQDSTIQGGSEQEEPIEEIIDDGKSATERPASDFAYVWRHNLLATEPYWSGWFAGLSQRFLTCKCARLLLLAGTDRLDKDLMIGQMQGKFQMTVFADVGHSLQEDAPQRTADILVQFWRRNEAVDVAAVKGLRKVGQ